MKRQRVTEVARILGELLTSEATRQARRIRRTDVDPLAAERERARALREALEGLGPLYIKMGQVLSTRPDMVSATIIEALQDLHEEVMVRPFDEFEHVLVKNLGPDWRARFATIETERPLGAASMAQVYAGTLHDGREVVVKVLRPHVAAQARLDMEILAQAVRLVMRRFPVQAELFQPEAMLESIFVAMRPEIDFTVEAANIEAFQKYTRDYKHLTVPDVVEVTKEVLIMTRAPGRSIRSADLTQFSGEERRAIARDASELLFRGFLVDGVFHADPHPGNIFVAVGEPATLIDFGMIGRIDRRTALGYTRFMLAMALNDGQAAGRAVVEMSTLTTRSDVPGFLNDMGRWVPSVVNLSLDNAEFGATFNQFLVFCSKRGIAVNPAVALFGKASANLEGTLRAIAPELTPVEVFREVMADVLRDQAKSMAAGGELMRLANETFIAAYSLPEQARYLAQSVFDGQFVLRTRDDALLIAQDREDARAKKMRRLILGLGAAALWVSYRNQS
ncbi:ABC1 kinase family protein [Sporichthya polymorpha]|uniref:ABC1 kinase family protein n=1 Tax=Sporichthya polymorpha TaxID=35751 RepID=UPI000379F61E|nr:AarF/UbiB family protein [Sporichthya polymorpha]